MLYDIKKNESSAHYCRCAYRIRNNVRNIE